MATETVPADREAAPLELAEQAAQVAGAVAFDAAAKRIGEVSSASFDRDGAEDHRAMVAVLQQALQAATDEGPEFVFGFLLPLVDLIDCHRLGLSPNDEWSGVAALREACQA